MTTPADRRRLAWLLQDRARLVRRDGLTCWSQLPGQAQEAFYAFAPILDDAAAALLEETPPALKEQQP